MKDIAALRPFRDSGHWAFVATVAAAYLASLIVAADRFDAGRIVLLAGLGVVFTLVGTYGFEYLTHDGSPVRAGAYFVIQLLLGGAISYASRAAGQMWLVMLPLVAHAVIVLPRRWMLAVCAVIVGLMIGVYTWQGGPWVGLQFGISYLAAVAFVIVFAASTVAAEHARGQVERLAADLTAANHKLREYAAQIEELATAKERNRLAREIHDSLGHYLTVINVQLEAAQAVLKEDPERGQAALQQAQTLVQEGLADVRRSVAALRAAPTDNRPLAEAIRSLVDECRASGILADLSISGVPRPLPPQTELTLYRAAQEALTNIRKHAHASRADLRLDYREPSRVRLVAQDNGVGRAAEANGGFGLVGLRERVQLLGGEVRVHTAPGQGFRLEVEAPG